MMILLLLFRKDFWILISFANGPGDMGSIPGWVIPKTLKMLNAQQYKLRVNGKVEQSWEKSNVLSYTSV